MTSSSLVDANVARATARREIASGPQRDDPQFGAWRDSIPGEPRLVHDLSGQPAYWLVPIRQNEKVVGAVRVLADGQAAASIAYRSGSDPLALNNTDILKRAAAAIYEDKGEQGGEVLLVHDGPPGREAWRVEVLTNGRVVRWIFVTPGGIYERHPGDVEMDQNTE